MINRLNRIDRTVTSILFWALLAGGLALRIALLFTNAFHVDSDNAIVFLIAKHISEGNITWFFWGQSYGGTLLEFVAGGAMLIFGAHFEVLSVVGVLFLVAVAVLVRSIATRAFDNRTTGNVAGTLFWFSGYWTMRVGVSEPGFYGPSLFLGLLTLWLALQPKDARLSALRWALLGLAAGLALWQSPMGAALAVPGVLIALARHRSWRHWLVGIAAALVGSLPWIINFTQNLSASVRPTGVSWNLSSLRSFVTIFTQVVPMAFSQLETVPRYTIGAIAIGLLVLAAVLAVRGFRQHNYWLGGLVASSLLVIAVIVIGSGILLRADSVRYSIFIMPALAIAVAWLVTRVPFTGIVCVLLAVASNLLQLQLLFPDLQSNTDQKYVVGDIKGLGDYLEENHITTAYGDYWIGYAVSAETNEEVTVASLSAPRRYTPYETAAATGTSATVIVLVDQQNDVLLQSAADLPVHTRAVVDGYAIYTFSQPFDAYSYQWNLY
ncbi:hypothetical protein [Subtercola sp. RTI3]|uniref:hypothetical protein n=1 Tax=Subtercola sp. RTI3 TaxID=3048639 RepID=UPI002B236693|nr:hypothetical protein [Subtercola sp. RTI3]MEA9984421.1 hypothetical protein [Subtercola sp. RTI3]